MKKTRRLPAIVKYALIVFGVYLAAIAFTELAINFNDGMLPMGKIFPVLAVLAIPAIIVYGAARSVRSVAKGFDSKDKADRLVSYAVFGAAWSQMTGVRDTRNWESKSSPGIVGLTIEEKNIYTETKKSDPRRR